MSEDPHPEPLSELERIEKEIKELESADDTSKRSDEDVPNASKDKTSEADETYEEKSKEEWKHNDKKTESRLILTEEEIEVKEEDF